MNNQDYDLTKVFAVREGGQKLWRAILNGVPIGADFTCRGSAEAALDVERRRRFVLGDTVACETCGQPTRSKGTKRCDPCWEVETRLPFYLKTAQGRANVASMLRHAEKHGGCDER
jgi:hypothetical protein